MSFIRVTDKATLNKLDIRADSIIAYQADGNGTVIRATGNVLLEVTEGMQAVRNRVKAALAGDTSEE